MAIEISDNQKMRDNMDEKFCPEIIIHLGAGKCSEILDYHKTNAKEIVLVDANPTVIQALKKWVVTHQLDNIKIIEAAVSNTNGPAIFYIYNIAAMSSLHQPTGLYKLYPGLKVSQQISVDRQNVIDIINSVNLQSEGNNLLVIDVPGEEYFVLDSLQENDALQLFSHIQLHCGNKKLYELDKTASEVLTFLQKQGFDVKQKNEEKDQDRPCWLLRRNDLKLLNDSLKQQLLIANQNSEQQRLLTSEFESQLEQLTQTRDEQTKLIAERELQIKQMSDARDEQAKLANERKILIDKLSQAQDEQDILVNEYQSQIKQINSELKQVRQNADLSLKMQMLKENDLQDLQQRYQAAMEIQINQNQLLRKLSERLRQASDYFHKLEISQLKEEKIDKKKRKQNRQKKLLSHQLDNSKQIK